ncbi:3-deoxy-7-phosphoheptulonate synthase [Kalymmatonema gypsitolerans NIES-4073]|nr:3-deoxy-7-phosphoheptulonate synthase [Scytonema sp. NIES-4073]
MIIVMKPGRSAAEIDQQYTRNTLDISALPVLQTLTHLPIMIDPSHATGLSEFVPTMAIGAIAKTAQIR